VIDSLGLQAEVLLGNILCIRQINDYLFRCISNIAAAEDDGILGKRTTEAKASAFIRANAQCARILPPRDIGKGQTLAGVSIHYLPAYGNLLLERAVGF